MPSDASAGAGAGARTDAAGPDAQAGDATINAEPKQDASAGDATQDASVADASMEDAEAPPVVPAAPCSAPRDANSLPSTLALTGCMDTAVPTQFAASVIPYEVNSPLWSDGADKLRGIHLPEAGKIHITDCTDAIDECPRGSADDGKWVFPAGSVLLKTFAFDDKLVETRLFARLSTETWIGYTYQWNDAQTEATLVPDDRVQVTFNTGARTVGWSYPNRIDCMKCHNAAAGFSLGLETAQLDRSVQGQNQIDTLVSRDIFDKAPVTPYTNALVTPYDGQAGAPAADASLESRARSYLHANCANCHRPDTDFPSLDLRYGVALENTGLCGSTPLKGDVGVTGATNLTPGQPMQSVTWLRMAAKPGEGRMPQIATSRVDERGVQLIGEWITSIAACP